MHPVPTLRDAKNRIPQLILGKRNSTSIWNNEMAFWKKITHILKAYYTPSVTFFCGPLVESSYRQARDHLLGRATGLDITEQRSQREKSLIGCIKVIVILS
jgi:hypothetical protein